MSAETGEYLVGAYIELIEGCDIVAYNVRAPEKGTKGQGEFDVLGFNFKTNTVFLCEVVTHLNTMLYSTGKDVTVEKINKKHRNQKEYAKNYLSQFENIKYQLWSPSVMKKHIDLLKKEKKLELVINQEYTKRVNELRIEAKKSTKRRGNPAFRMLQILGHLRKEK